MSDPFFGPAVLDVDEWRDAPVRHRFVHGSFKGTDTRFTAHFPEPEHYQGRVVQFLEGERGGNENVSAMFGGLLIAGALGAVLCESNQGHIGLDMTGLKGDPSILEWRASAQTAREVRRLAAEMYGDPPHHTYVFGGSGGAMRTVSCVENASDVYAGGVAFMLNRSGLIAWNWSLLAWAWSVLADDVPAIVDALDPGGSGDPFAAVSSDAGREALAALYRGGFPRGAEAQIEANPLWVLSMQIVAAADPQWFLEPPNDGDVFTEKCTVQGVRTSGEIPVGDLGMGGVPPTLTGRNQPSKLTGIDVDLAGGTARFLGSTITFLSGSAAGRRLICTGRVGETIVAGMDVKGFAGVEPGDEIEVSNASFVAFCRYHRHLGHLPYDSTAAFRVDERPIHATRPAALAAERNSVPTGRFDGKLILLQHTHDRECWPECAIAYERSVRAALGAETEDRFRLWWIENASHLPPVTAAAKDRLINYGGTYARAVNDLVGWVEDGTAPPPSTTYTWGPDCLLSIPPTASERGGIQPVVTATVNGGARAEVQVGETVDLAGEVDIPPGGGEIVTARWQWPGGKAEGLEAKASFDAPGTYFPVLHVATERTGDTTAFAKVRNLARVRVVVT